MAGSQVMTPLEDTAPAGRFLPRLLLSPRANDSSARGTWEGAGHAAQGQGQADTPGRSRLQTNDNKHATPGAVRTGGSGKGASL